MLKLAVADFEAVIKRYSQAGDTAAMLGLVLGGQRDQYGYHAMLFDFNSLSASLESAGLVNVRRYDSIKTDHAHVDDYSQAFLPHMDKEHGLLISLNVLADKP